MPINDPSPPPVTRPRTRAVLHICEGCKDADDEKRKAGTGGGPEILAAVQALATHWPPELGIAIEAYDCIGNCKKRVRASIAAPGKWTWLFADLTKDDLPALEAFVMTWVAANDGMVKAADRPPAIRPKILGRVPPPP